MFTVGATLPSSLLHTHREFQVCVRLSSSFRDKDTNCQVWLHSFWATLLWGNSTTNWVERSAHGGPLAASSRISMRTAQDWPLQPPTTVTSPFWRQTVYFTKQLFMYSGYLERETNVHSSKRYRRNSRRTWDDQTYSCCRVCLLGRSEDAQATRPFYLYTKYIILRAMEEENNPTDYTWKSSNTTCCPGRPRAIWKGEEHPML